MFINTTVVLNYFYHFHYWAKVCFSNESMRSADHKFSIHVILNFPTSTQIFLKTFVRTHTFCKMMLYALTPRLHIFMHSPHACVWVGQLQLQYLGVRAHTTFEPQNVCNEGEIPTMRGNCGNTVDGLTGGPCLFMTDWSQGK